MSLDEWIKAKIEEDFNPEFINLVNESHKHSGHAGDDGSGETHYKLEIISSAFDGMSRVQRQRAVYSSLSQAFDKGLHALSLKLSTE